MMIIMISKSCSQCKKTFPIHDEDTSFYKKISPKIDGKIHLIPPPTLCPECRQQRRMTWRNERNLYHRKCDLTGKQIISIYSPEKPFKVYEQNSWWGDTWDSCNFGRDFDFQTTFSEQFYELMKDVPRLAIMNKNSVNSDYCNYSFSNKNCYLTFGNHYEEDCFYGHYSTKNKNCMDYLYLYGSEFCYECMFSDQCYQCVYLDHCENCQNCRFSIDLKGCKNCLFSANLRHKEYYIYNKAFTKEEYEKKLKSLQLETRSGMKKAIDYFLNEFRRSFPLRGIYQINCENCEGNNIKNSKNLRKSFDCSKCEECAYIVQSDEAYHSMDMVCMGYDHSEWCYETIGCTGTYHCQFCDSCWHDSDMLYCNLCFSNKNCFGCIALQRKEYCIFNKQYTKEEYEKLLPKIIDHMRQTGEWGEFFSPTYSPFAYDETIAQEYFPLSKEEKPLKQNYLGPQVKISEHIDDVEEGICEKILTCEISGKPYKVIPQELRFYKKMQLPIPLKSPVQRHQDRLTLRNPRKLWSRQCKKCGKEIETSYPPDRPEIIYCEECYLKEVY